MKTFLIALIASILVASSYQGCCQTCTNAFNTAHANGYTGTAASSTQTNHYCHAIWNQNGGTCCDETLATTYFTNWSSNMDTQKDAIKNKLSSINWNTLKSNAGIVKSLLNSLKTLWANKNISTANWDRLASDLELTNEALPHTGDLSASLDTCYAAFKEFRHEAFCLRCSGKGDEFWNSVTNRYSVEADSCNKIVNNCGVAFALSAYANRIYDSINSLWTQKDSSTQVADNGNHSILSNDDIKQILNCGKDINNCLKDANLKITLCNQFALNGDNTNLQGDVNLWTSAANHLSNPQSLSASNQRRVLPEKRNLSSAANMGLVEAKAGAGFTLQSGQYTPESENEYARIFSFFAVVSLAFFGLF